MAKQVNTITRTHVPLQEAWKRAGFAGIERTFKEVGEKLAKKTEASAGVGDLANLLKTATGCPSFQIPVVDQVSLRFAGPLSSANAKLLFPADFDLFGTSRTAPGLATYETTFPTSIGGETQQSKIIIGYGLQLEVDPRRFSAPVNALATPVAATSPGASPDAMTWNDTQLQGATATPIGTAANTNQIPGLVDWGNWLDDAFWFFVRAWNMRWRIGDHETILDEPAINRAYLKDNVQDGTASSSQVPLAPYIEDLNEYYRSYLATQMIARRIDHVRYGVTNKFGSTGTATASLMRISRAYDFIDLTYGGAGFRRLRGDCKGNGDMNRLPKCIAWPRGVQYGLKLFLNDTVYGNEFYDRISADRSEAVGVIPSIFTDDVNIVQTTSNVTTAGLGNGAPEYSSDSPQALTNVGAFTQNADFKGGWWAMTLFLKGYPFPQTVMGALCANADMLVDFEERCKCLVAGQQ